MRRAFAAFQFDQESKPDARGASQLRLGEALLLTDFSNDVAELLR
jgi:hypothetical protein